MDIWQRGYFSESRQIVVDQPESWFTVGLRLGSLGAADSTDITGKLLPTDAGKEDRRWVKLVGLYSDSTFETLVEKSGSFSFKGINFGSYILLTMSGAKVCDTRRVDVSLPIPFSITVNLTSSPCIE